MKQGRSQLEQFDDYWIIKNANEYGNALCLKTSWESARFLDLITRHKIRTIRLTEGLGWRDADLSFLVGIPGIQGLDIWSDKVTDISPVFQLKKLKSLSIYCKTKVAGDFLKLGNLRKIGLDWRDVYQSIFGLTALTRINISHYPEKDLAHWKRNIHLRELQLESTRLEALSGIELFPNIKQLRLYGCRKLSSLAAVAKSIQKLRIDQCPGIDDLSPLSHLSDLQELEIENCHDIKSLAPLAKCKKLRRLQIAGNTTVLDGDFNSLAKLPNLKYALLANRKHYSHSGDELEQ